MGQFGTGEIPRINRRLVSSKLVLTRVVCMWSAISQNGKSVCSVTEKVLLYFSFLSSQPQKSSLPSINPSQARGNAMNAG